MLSELCQTHKNEQKYRTSTSKKLISWKDNVISPLLDSLSDQYSLRSFQVVQFISSYNKICYDVIP